MGTKRRARRAWTLVEMVIVVLIVGVALTLALSLFFSGQRKSSRLDFRLRALQSAHLLRARFANDLAAYIPGPQEGAEVPRAAALTLLRVPLGDGAGEDGLCLNGAWHPQVESVTYRFDAKTNQVLRNGKPLQIGLFKDVAFGWYPYRPGLERGETLMVHCVLVPDEALRGGKVARADLVQVSFSFHCGQTTLVRVYDEWIGNP